MNWIIARLGENSSRVAIAAFLTHIADQLSQPGDLDLRKIGTVFLIALAAFVTPEKDSSNA
jgi:hypothetical protein